MKLVSVIVPVYNSEKWIRECLESILNQTYTNLEIIVVDDGSTDDSSSIIDELTKKDTRIVKVIQNNSGVSAARNSGLEMAKGEIIAFVDSDDVIHPKMYEILVTELEKNDLDILSCGVTRNRNFSITDTKPVISTKETALYECFKYNYGLCLWNRIYKRDVIKGIKFPVGRKFEDASIGHLFIAQTKKTGYVNAILYYYRKNLSSICQTSFNIKDRYDYFLAMQERYFYGSPIYPELEGKLLGDSISAGLAVLTAVYANYPKSKDNKYYSLVYSYLLDQKNKKKSKLGLSIKYKLLFAIFNRFDFIHIIYAILSRVMKHRR